VRLLRHHALHILDHHDGVVDHDADGEHEGEQRDGVGRHAKRQHRREGADQRHWHRNQRDDGRAPVAEEQEDHDHDQRKRFGKRTDDLVNRGVHEIGRVIADVVGDIGRKALRQLCHDLPDAARDLDRVGARL
jgi:hypothetical protein